MRKQLTAVRFKWVGRYDPRFPILRLCRVMWERGDEGRKLSVGLRPKLWQRNAGAFEWAITALGVRLHFVRGGGRYV